MRRPGFLSIFDEAGLFLWPKRLADVGASLELEELLLPQPDPQYISLGVHYAEEEADFLIDRLRGGLLTEPGLLVFLDHVLIDVDQHLVPEQSLDVPEGIHCECCRAWVAQFVADKVFVGQILNGPHALLANILQIVETLLKLAPTFLLSSLREGL
ncbi:MAG TPA: hypothetical protein VMT86_04960 [Bryobacteraceae bacterium]|nr:hypothetical protein [Bryobacteraceae bacterium]